MDLHRVEKHPDWHGVPADKMNAWQKVANASRGIITVGNFFSLIGLLSVPLGLWLIVSEEKYIGGIVVLALGRACDLADGLLADKTGTKSPLGEKIDATFDKLSTATTVLVLALGSVVSWWAVVLLLAPHAVIAVIASLSYRKGHILHPSRTGKISMAVAWFSIVAFIAIPVWSGAAQNLTQMTAYGLLSMSVLLGVWSIFGYIKEFRSVFSRVR